MRLFDPDQSTATLPTEPAARTRRLGPGILLYAAVVAFALGAFIQMRAAAVVVTCERDKRGAPGCVLDRRVLFNTVSIGRERVTGVRAARIEHRTGTSRGRRSGAFAVVLDTAEGERDVGWSTEWNPAAVMTTAISRHIASGAGRFEESLQPHFFDSLLRLFGLIASLVGLGLVPLALVRWRHGASA